MVCTIATHAQEDFIKPQAKLLASFPIKLLSGGVIILQATLSDFPDTLNFILDTGSGGISLDSTTVAYLKLKVTPSQRTIRGLAGTRTVSFVLNQRLNFPGLAVHQLDFHINDYDILTSVYGLKIDGIIGYSFLSRYIVKVDYDKYLLQVYSQGSISYPRQGWVLRPRLNNLPVFGASIRDGRSSTSSFYFDTGAGLCLLLSEEYAGDSLLTGRRKKIIETQGEGLGGKKAMRLTTVKEMRLGPYKFRNVPVHLFHDDNGLTNYPELGGLVGNDLLRRFNLVLNYEKKEIHLSPNTHFEEPFDYSYTGLGIYLVDGEIVIEDVIKNSPGERAGLQPGDVIISVNNNLSGNIQVYKNILQLANSRARMIIRRGNQLKEVVLKVQSIL
nr:aspartyl protease family protein [Aridibaculum aurantiacum]